MIRSVGWGAAALLLVAAPVLAFPAALGPSALATVAVFAAVVMLGAVGLVSDFGRLPWYVAVLVVAAIFAGIDVAEQPETINHFAGLALGLFAMGTVAAWCRTRARFALAVFAFVLCGAVIVAIGFRSVSPLHAPKTMFGKPAAATSPLPPLPLGDLHSPTVVNRNPLAAVAMMILPVAATVARFPLAGSSARPVLQITGSLATLATLAVVLAMQSRSVWLAAACLAWLVVGRVVPALVWWAMAVAAFVVAPVIVYALWGDQPWAVGAIQSVRMRFDIWDQALQALRASPWSGIGFDHFRHGAYAVVRVSPEVIAVSPHAHNFFLQTALDVGLIGLVAYLAVTGFVLRRAHDLSRLTGGDRWVRAVGVAAGLSVLSVQVFGLLDAIALGTKVGIFQWLACGLVLAAWSLHASATAEL